MKKYYCKKCNILMNIEYLKYIEKPYCAECTKNKRYSSSLITFGTFRPLKKI